MDILALGTNPLDNTRSDHADNQEHSVSSWDRLPNIPTDMSDQESRKQARQRGDVRFWIERGPCP